MKKQTTGAWPDLEEPGSSPAAHYTWGQSQRCVGRSAGKQTLFASMSALKHRGMNCDHYEPFCDYLDELNNIL